MIQWPAYFAYIHSQVYERLSTMWKIAMDPYYAKEIAACGLFDFLVSGELNIHEVYLSDFCWLIQQNSDKHGCHYAVLPSKLLTHYPSTTLLYESLQQNYSGLYLWYALFVHLSVRLVSSNIL